MDRLIITESGRKLLEGMMAKDKEKWERFNEAREQGRRLSYNYEFGRRLNILLECRSEAKRPGILDNGFLLEKGWAKRAESFRRSMERSLSYLVSREYIMEY